MGELTHSAEKDTSTPERVWDECVAWIAYAGQADVKGWVLEAAEQANPYRPVSTCGERYGSNPDPCHREANHPGAHSNRYGTTWASREQWLSRVTPPDNDQGARDE